MNFIPEVGVPVLDPENGDTGVIVGGITHTADEDGNVATYANVRWDDMPHERPTWENLEEFLPWQLPQDVL